MESASAPAASSSQGFDPASGASIAPSAGAGWPKLL